MIFWTNRKARILQIPRGQLIAVCSVNPFLVQITLTTSSSAWNNGQEMSKCEMFSSFNSFTALPSLNLIESVRLIKRTEIAVHSERGNFSVWQSFWCLFADSNGLFCVFYWGEASVWPLCHKAQIGGVLQWLSFWKFLPSPHGITGAQPEGPSGSRSPVTKALLPNCSVWPGSQL